MKKIIIISILLVICAAIGVSAADITQSSPTFTWAKSASTSISQDMTLTNTGSSDFSSVFFTTSDLISGSATLNANIVVTPNPASLNAGQTKTVTVTVSTIPLSQPTGTYTGILTSHYNGDETNSTITITVEDARYDITLPSSIQLTDAKRGKTISRVFTIKNEGNVQLTNVIFGSSIPLKYAPSFDPSPFTLNPSASKQIQLDLSIPEGEDVGNKSLGSISVSSAQHDFGSLIPVSADIVSALRIDRVDVAVGKFGEKGVDEGDTFEDEAVPGDTVVLRVRLENLFTSQEDVKIRDIELKGTIQEVDNGEDLEVTPDDTFDLNADNNDDVYLTFNLPQDADDGNYNVLVEASGDDENSNSQDDTFEFSIDISRKSHEVRFTNVNLEKTEVKCGEDAQLNVEALNIGRKDESTIKVAISSPKLNYEKDVSDISLDSASDGDNTYTTTFSIPIPQGTQEGNYPITAKVFYDSSILDDSDTVQLTVKNCNGVPIISPQKNVTTAKPPVTVTFPQKNLTQPVPISTATENGHTPVAEPTSVTISYENSFFDSQDYVIILVLTSVVILLLIVIVIAHLVTDKNSY